MASKTHSRTRSISTKLSPSEDQLVRAYCSRKQTTTAELLRVLLLREVGSGTPSEMDAGAALFRLFVDTMKASLEAENSPEALTPAKFQKLVAKWTPRGWSGSEGDSHA
jgi:hypothetical protein